MPRKISHRLPVVTHEMRIKVDELRHNMTESERILCAALRSTPNLGRFHRQRVIGKYIVDFVSLENGIVIDLDGSQHVQNVNVAEDVVRDNYLKELGFVVMRFTNLEVDRNVQGVIEMIIRVVEKG